MTYTVDSDTISAHRGSIDSRSMHSRSTLPSRVSLYTRGGIMEHLVSLVIRLELGQGSSLCFPVSGLKLGAFTNLKYTLLHRHKTLESIRETFRNWNKFIQHVHNYTDNSIASTHYYV